MHTPGLNHVVLTIAQKDRSIEFYRDLLGFEVKEMVGGPEGFYFYQGDLGFFMLVSEHTAPGDRFNEARVGLDHLAFTAPNRTALHELANRLLAAGVDTKGVEQFVPTGNWYMAFRDPDNIQLEYWLP